MLETMIFSLRELRTSIPVWLVIILFIGFVFAPGAADVDQLKSAGLVALSTGKIIRAVSVVIVGLLVLMIHARSGGIFFIFKGNLALMTTFALVAFASVANSDLKTVTLYKSVELFVITMIAATVYIDKNPEDAARKFIVGILWLYILILIGVYGQLFIFGKEEYRQIGRGDTFLTFMLSSFYPPIAGNSLGFMGAIATLFGAFIYFLKCTKAESNTTDTKRKMIGFFLILFSLAIVVLSYTRSILVILGVVGLIYLVYSRKYAWFFLCVSLLVIVLALPQTRSALEAHMMRGDSQENLETLSSRTMLWKMALDKDIVSLIMGEGYATGTMFTGYDASSWFGAKTQRVRNAHNSVLEIINSIGILGAIIWIILMLRIFFQLLFQYMRYKRIMAVNDRYFHLLILMISLMSILRSMMNSTYVYLDLFMPLLLAMAVYADTFPALFKDRTKESRPGFNSSGIGLKADLSGKRILNKRPENIS